MIGEHNVLPLVEEAPGEPSVFYAQKLGVHLECGGTGNVSAVLNHLRKKGVLTVSSEQVPGRGVRNRWHLAERS